MVAISSISCQRGELYSHYEALPISGWEADSVVDFTFSANDTISPYQLVLSVRHFETYPYQNIWLFTELYEGEEVVKSDTLEFYLANQRGQWLGNGFGNRKEMPMLYRQGYRFPHSGEYRVRVKHGMRQQSLRGVSDIGLIVTQE